MVASLWKLCVSNLHVRIASNIIISTRNGHHLRGKPPGIARTLQQRLDELNKVDPELAFKVDIGLPASHKSRSELLKERMEITKANRRNSELEKLARHRKLLVNLHEVNEDWHSSDGSYHIKTIAEHYGVYQDLFGDAYFVPRTTLNIAFEAENVALPVYHGNVLKPADTKAKPNVQYNSDENSLWTLILTNPDGHLTKQNSEYVHWFIGNIPGNNVDKGEIIVDYLQPFPPKGTGYHRLIFILYKQDKKLDFSSLKKTGKCLNLEQRTFSTLDFYRERQDDITPAGLSFFQCDWDETLTDFYHNTLNMQEPIFEYDFPKAYHPPQRWFPKKQAFNLYMDRYRDPKQINKEFLVRKLKDVHPFKAPPTPLQYPNAQYMDDKIPTWLKLEIRKSRLKKGRINEIN